jgi:hypothetical protein
MTGQQEQGVRSALFWDFSSVEWSFLTDVSERHPRVKKPKTYLPLKMGPIGCPETSVFKDQEIQDLLTLEDGDW